MKQIIFFLSFLITISVNAADLLVYTGASYPDFSSISTAVDSSSDGDRILISSGNYIGNINFSHKSISLLPMTSNDNFVIQGDLIFNKNNVSSSFKEITLSSAEIIGEIKTIGNLITPYIFNIIDCEIFGRIELNVDDFSTNLYYSKFYTSILLNHASEIVGNSMNSSSYFRDTLLVQNGIFNFSPNNLSSNMKIYTNHIEEYLIKCDLSSSTHIITTNLCNNFILGDRSANMPLMYFDGFSSTLKAENNTFKKYLTGSTSQLGLIINNHGLVKIELWNNLFLQTNYSGSYCGFFNSNSGPNTIWDLKNNYFNWDPSLNSSIELFRNGNNPNTLFESNNIYDMTFSSSSSLNSTNLNDTSGIPLTNLLLVTENLGYDVIQCRDIDDTQNNIGPWGGPHSWANYHTPSLGKGKIIDLNLISTFGSSSNSLLNIRSKAVNIK